MKMAKGKWKLDGTAEYRGKQCVDAGQKVMTPELWGVIPPFG
jgi:hypothetical protein